MSYVLHGVSSRFDKIKYNAYWNNAHLDSRMRVTKDLVDDAVSHLNDCINNPTIGLLARKKFRTYNYPDCFKRNLEDLHKYKSVQTADQAFNDHFSALYPRTGNARKFLINSKSIVLDYVKPLNKSLRRAFFKMFNRI